MLNNVDKASHETKLKVIEAMKIADVVVFGVIKCIKQDFKEIPRDYSMN